MNKSDQINELSTALAKAQLEIENAGKNATNSHFGKQYADLAQVLNTVRPVFAAHGLSFVQMPSFLDGKASVETMLMHSSGQYISNTCSAPVSKQDAQGVGSAITYLRRYSLAAFAGVAQEDDDGNMAVGGPQQSKAKPQPQPQPPIPMDAATMEKAAAAIRDGKATVQRIGASYILSDEQRQALIAIETQTKAEQS